MNLKDRTILEILIFGLIVLAIAFFAVKPVLCSVKTVILEMNIQEAENKRTDERIESVKNFNQFHREKKEDFSKINLLFMDSEMPLGFIDFLEKTAADCQVKVAFSPSMPLKTGNDAWESVNFETIMSGSFNGVMQFIKKMESSPYLVEIKKLEIKNKETSQLPIEDMQDIAATVEAKMTMKVFSK